MRNRTTGLTAFALAALLGSAPAAAQSPDFSWHGTLAAGKTIEIRGVSGRIDASPASGNTVEVSAVKRERRHGDAEDVKVEVVEGSNGVTICAVYPTPRRARDENHCGSGRDYQMNTQDNDVEVNFTVKVPRGVRLEATTVNGDIRATDLAGDAELHTVNGGIDVTTSGLVEAETVNGDIDARIGRADWNGRLEFSTVNGGITLTAPASLATDVEASTVNGSVDSDFPITIQGRMERRHLRGTIGSGGRSLELTTVNGGIELRKGT
ncbi:MAG TPA: DUF4097 family beta strand repeat-containing protein [Gemmatimonadales bacterium]|nr:DUF4097 family beta strand repeat-containing protein [Gemmatimonadales bacterium]